MNPPLPALSTRIVYTIVYLLIKQRGRESEWAIFQVVHIIDSFEKMGVEVVHGLISGSYKCFYGAFLH